MTNHHEKAMNHSLPSDQKARNPAYPYRNTKPLLQASFRAETLVNQWEGHKAENENNDERFLRAKAQDKHRRDATTKFRYRQAFSAYVFAQRDLSGHIYKFFPFHLQTSSSILCRTWFLVHRKVAELALHQALLLARRRGLKRVPDTKHFLEVNCSWYLSFCTLSRMLFG